MLMAKLFHNATALRNIDGPEDVLKIPPAQKELALSTFEIGQRALEACIESAAYRNSLKCGKTNEKFVLIDFSLGTSCSLHTRNGYFLSVVVTTSGSFVVSF